ncbi:MAG: hypothetical protein IAE97_02270 [Chthoniobacterales bacterium]|nr:hypothetical protein [Chthoniobacterales bacterium]
MAVRALVHVPFRLLMSESPTKSAPKRKHHALETEVIWAVVGLYVFIATVLLLIHHLQPEGQETHTSSPSPSHAARYGVPGGEPHTVRESPVKRP